MFQVNFQNFLVIKLFLECERGSFSYTSVPENFPLMKNSG
jgi:hypothetical protein